MEEDIEIMEVAQEQNLEYTMVLTKVDVLPRDSRGTGLKKRLLRDLSHDGTGSTPEIVASSTKTRVGRDEMWRRIWSCIDPANPRWKGLGLEAVQAELDSLTASQDVDALSQRSEELLGEAWEYAIRCILSCKQPCIALAMVQKRLLAAQVAEEVEFTPAQARATLAVAEAALAMDPLERSLATEALAMLQQGQEGETAIELQLELLVSDVSHTGSDTSAAPDLAARLQQLEMNAEAWASRPWSLDRWERLLQLLAKQRDLRGMYMVVDTMKRLRVRQTEQLS
eukprot:1168601-Amphidinium_carterae.1